MLNHINSTPSSIGIQNIESKIIKPDANASVPKPVVQEAKAVKPTGEATSGQLQEAVKTINDAFKHSNINMEFQIDSDTKQTVVKMVDGATGELLRQYPSEEAIAISKSINKMQSGILLRQKG